jgi:predicted enzyme related to lactoylglutathione lyase
MPLRFESSHWTEFGTEGATLALHAAQEASPVAAPADDLPPGHCRPGLQVPDLDAFHRRMVEHGVTCLQEPKDQFGARLAQYVDPDGLVISVGEPRKG